MKQRFKDKAESVNERLAKGAGKIKVGIKGATEAIDRHHEQISDHADSITKATKVAAGVAIAGAAIAAPTGLTAVGVAIGIVSAPLIVTAAPILASAAGVAVTISAGASLYSKIRRKQQKAKAELEQKDA